MKILAGNIIKIKPLSEIMKTLKEEEKGDHKYFLHKETDLRFFSELIELCKNGAELEV